MNSHTSHCMHYMIDMHLVSLRFIKFKTVKSSFLSWTGRLLGYIKWTSWLLVHPWEFVGTGQPIVLTNMNWSTVSSIKGTITTIKLLVFARNIYIASLITKLDKEFEHISYTSYFKSKTTSKSSIINHTHICALKPS
jgi:hypothetical protein